MFGEESEPTGSDLVIGPEGDDIGTDAEDGVIVIFEDGEGADFDSEDSGEDA